MSLRSRELRMSSPTSSRCTTAVIRSTTTSMSTCAPSVRASQEASSRMWRASRGRSGCSPAAGCPRPCRCASSVAPRCWDPTERRAVPRTMNALVRVLLPTVLCAVLAAFAATIPVPAAHADELKDGRNALAAGQLDDALKFFEKAAAQGYAEGRAGVGQVWLRKRNYEKALEQFELAARMDA